MHLKILLVLSMHLTLVGCTTAESIYSNIYQGLSLRDAVAHPAAEQNSYDKTMSFQRYETERKQVLENSRKQ